jgi:hypothetical protein
MRSFRARVAVVLAALSLVAAAPAASVQAESNSPPRANAAHRCGAGYTHAVLPNGHKCLRRGQFCRRSWDRRYHRYGFHCHRYDRSVDRYRLT